MTDGDIDLYGVAWRAAATLFCVLLNGFFVSAEFALVKVRAARVDALAQEGKRTAPTVKHLLAHLDHYLSACQLGITIASLALGALGEPAVAYLLRGGLVAMGFEIDPQDTALRLGSFLLAFLTITTLHMTLGEQAPKMWALHHSDSTALQTAYPLRAFSFAFTPFIALINKISNAMLRLAGLGSVKLEEAHTSDELLSVLESSAKAGHITPRQQEFAENVLWMVNLEVRHLLVPRVEVEFISLERSTEDNLARIEGSRHSRFPVCEVGLDTVVGVLHTKDLIGKLRSGEPIDLRALARPALYVAETQPVPRLILDLQSQRQACAMVVDERGSCSGMVFLEDALEEIVGPIQDEFDTELPDFVKTGPDSYEVSGRMPLPEAMERLGLDLHEPDEDTIGGYVVSRLGRLPKPDDEIELGPYRVAIERLSKRSIHRLRFERHA